MKKIALYTDFGPATGGGAAILRNLIDRFSKVQIAWFYSAPQVVQTANTFRIQSLNSKGNLIGDFIDFYQLWTGGREHELAEMARPILNYPADAHWVVAHGVGVAMGNYLKSARPAIPLHVTVHDDPQNAALKRSRRFRYVSCLIGKPVEQLLTCADSIDVISQPMQEYYYEKYGVRSEIVHVCVEKMPFLDQKREANHCVSIGHIGSIYSHSQFEQFLCGADKYANSLNKRAVVKLIGRQIWDKKKFERNLSSASSVEILGEMNEADAIARLISCDFVYAAYPFSSLMRIFRQTSLPTKLSTYVQVQRPIFAHTPLDSSLARIVGDYKIGVVCPHRVSSQISDGISQIFSLNVPNQNYEKLRENIFGYHNVVRLENLLSGYVKAPAE